MRVTSRALCSQKGLSMRKPIGLTLNGQRVVSIQPWGLNDADLVFLHGDYCGLGADDCRRLRAWLDKAIEYLEEKE